MAHSDDRPSADGEHEMTVADLPRTVTGTELAGELRRRQLAALLEHSPDATVIVDADGGITEWNPAAAAMLGARREDVVGVTWRSLVPVELRPQFDAAWSQLVDSRVRLPTRSFVVQQDAASPTVRGLAASIWAGDRFAGAVAIMRPTGAPEPPPARPSANLVQLLARSLHAQRPDLWSRGAQDDGLAVARARRAVQARLAAPIPSTWTRGVAVLEIDALELVNEAYGPDAGDEVLDELDRRLSASVTTGAPGLWQGGVFVWVVDTPDAHARLTELTEEALASLREPFAVSGDQLQLTASLGLSTSATVPVPDLISAAMSALRAAKEAGRDRAVWYSEQPGVRATTAFHLSSDLHRAIEDGELRLHFQPIVDLVEDAVVGVEALVRWERPGFGLLGPDAFVEIAERTGQIVALGSWVARAACRAAVELRALDRRELTVSVNVSARQLGDPGLVGMLDRALRDARCPPSALIVEITETALMNDLAAVTLALGALKKLGVRLDLDDFGTGYSSLLYLKHFPVDRIKIDRSFIAGLGSDPADTTIVASTIALAHGVGLRAVAEGVETPGQLELLREMGCDYVQGFLVSRPLEAAALAPWLDAHAATSPTGHDGPIEDLARIPALAMLRAADTRAVQADRRDAVAERRDRAADRRDDEADKRDAAADARDAVADVRDDRADVRDDRADVRDATAEDRGGRAPGT